MLRKIIFKIGRKAYEKLITPFPYFDRFLRYRNPRKYWRDRGGSRYFEEQEGVHDRTIRSRFIASEIAKLDYRSILEIGCGYGKQLKNLCREEIFVVGCDFSYPQLAKAKEHCQGLKIWLVEGDGAKLPFRDRSFDLVLSSAVILHNPFEKAREIISEMIRVSRKYIVHNEDTDITFSRYGYDMKKTYEKMNFKILKSGPIPAVSGSVITQFVIAESPAPHRLIEPPSIALQYH